jgi:S1-C subfamily serine protease
MSFRRRKWVVALLVVALALIAAGAAARLAFARGAVARIGSGVVDIETNLGYEGSSAAGTGIVLTSSGEVLTNNHVIRGATTIRIVLPQSRRSYTATVLGYDVAADVALLKAQGASGLRTASIGNSSKLRLGQTVVGVGNAGGTGTLASARGRITGLGKTITASDGQSSEQLTGLIETNANIQPGDSGGPLLDSAHRVVGIDTAGSVGFRFETATTDAYAIPINRAMTIARQIAAGRASANVHIGPTAFLGVNVTTGGFGRPATAGVLVAAVVPGSPADKSGLIAGDVITAVDGQSVTTTQAVGTIVLRHAPGSTIQLAFVDQLGNQQTATTTLVSGPPQ